MKYEFHVGDYVENKYGEVGYITNVTYSDLHMSKDAFYNIDIAYHNVKDIIGAFHGDQNLILNYFVRIGQYDFTKKDEGKIEPLAEEYIKSFPICKTTTTVNDSEWRSIDIGAVGKKINELVDVVNHLEEKVNERMDD
jgi:hypothetical protein